MAFDFRKRWTSSWIYELPFGRDRKYMNQNTALDYVLGGWQIGGILTFQDGFPFTLGCSTGTVQNGGGGCYPDPAPGNPDWQLDDPTRERWFNTAAFVDRNPEFGTGARYGTVKRNTVVGPGIKSFDMSFNKNFRIADDNLEFRIEVFNLPNVAIWGQPGSQLGTPTYGVITSTRLDSRQVQIGLKYVF